MPFLLNFTCSSHDWLWSGYLARKPSIRTKIRGLSGSWKFFSARPDELIGNLNYAVAMARLRYWVVPSPLPEANNIAALGQYWKTYYNSIHGSGTVDKFVNAYKD